MSNTVPHCDAETKKLANCDCSCRTFSLSSPSVLWRVIDFTEKIAFINISVQKLNWVESVVLDLDYLMRVR